MCGLSFWWQGHAIFNNCSYFCLTVLTPIISETFPPISTYNLHHILINANMLKDKLENILYVNVWNHLVHVQYFYTHWIDANIKESSRWGNFRQIIWSILTKASEADNSYDVFKDLGKDTMVQFSDKVLTIMTDDRK